jgi:hypothetical protein
MIINLLPVLGQLNLRLHPLQIRIIFALLIRVPLVFALVGVPPRFATTFVEIDQDVGAGVTPSDGDLGFFDGIEVLVFAGLRFGVIVVMSSHD